MTLPPLHLTYCMNAHPGETWPAVFDAIRTYPPLIRDRVAPGQPFGLGLRLSHRAACELERQPEALRDLRLFLADHALYVFTINGFPYGDFHESPVKDAVYQPDWSTPDRRDYTIRLARLLARLLPDGLSGSISTAPLAYRRHPSAGALADMVRHLAETVAALAEIRDRTGREIHLGLEPEPDCILETTRHMLDFYQDTLLPDAIPMIATHRACPSAEAERNLRRHLGVCLDTCHLAMQFEDPRQSLVTLADAGIRISKIQISAALETRGGIEAADALRGFADPVYLHQVRVRKADGSIRSYPDLPDALRAGPCPGSTWRIHFHVPLHVERHGPLTSTAADLTSGFFETARQRGVDHVEIETYTFDVLPEPLRARGIVDSIAREFAWTLARLNAEPPPGH